MARKLTTRRPRQYHSLLQRDGISSPWRIEFGAYDRSDVTAELEDYRDHGALKRDLKIITTGAGRADIEAAVAALNQVAV